MHFFDLMQLLFVNGTCPGKSWKKDCRVLENPGIWSLLVLESPGKKHFNVCMNPEFCLSQTVELLLLSGCLLNFRWLVGKWTCGDDGCIFLSIGSVHVENFVTFTTGCYCHGVRAFGSNIEVERNRSSCRRRMSVVAAASAVRSFCGWEGTYGRSVERYVSSCN